MGKCDSCLLLGRSTLPQCDTAGNDRQQEERAGAGEQQAQAPVAPPLLDQVALVLDTARVHELALQLVELERVLRRPVERGRESRPAVQLGRVLAALAPFAGGCGQVRVQAAALAILLEPFLKTRPLPQQRLVRDFDCSFADREQTAVGEDSSTRATSAFRSASNSASGTRRRTTLSPAPGPASRRRTLRTIGFCSSLSAGVRFLGEARDRTSNAARRSVLAGSDRPPVTPFPQLEQRRREQRQRTRLPEHLGDELVDERGLDANARVQRRLLDRAPVLLGRHGTDEHVVRTEQLGEGRTRRTAAVEVGAERENDDLLGTRVDRCLDDRGQEGCALVLVGAEREHLLELVDHQHEPLVRSKHFARRTQRAVLALEEPADPLGQRRPQRTVELPQRMLAGPHLHDDPLLAVREDAGLQRRAQGPARTADDLPLPDGPTTPRSGAPASRAISSATRRSRPKNHSTSPSSKLARPLYGGSSGSTAPRPGPAPKSRACSRTS